MEDRIEKIFSEARRLSLTADEKSAGREMLRSYMALTPMVAPQQTAKKPAFGFARAWTHKTAAAFSVSLAVLLSAASVSYAAEGALPGDLLYPVKVGVNEEVRATVAVSAQAKASWEAERAERRLAEAEQLATRGRLRAETRIAIEAQFRNHAERAQKGIAELEDSSDIEAAANVNAHLEGSLRAHKKIIAMLADDSNDDDDTQVNALEASVDHETQAAEEFRGKNEARVAAEASTEAKTAAEGRRGAAVRKIAEVRAYLAANRASLGDSATAEAEARLDEADATVAEGNAKLDAGENGAAFALFAKAQRQAQEAKLLIRAGNELKIKAKAGGLRLDLNADVNAAANGRGDATVRHEQDGGAPAGSTDDGDQDAGKDRRIDVKTDLRIGSGEDRHGAKGGTDAKLDL
jgi:hypothetical protein